MAGGEPWEAPPEGSAADEAAADAAFDLPSGPKPGLDIGGDDPAKVFEAETKRLAKEADGAEPVKKPAAEAKPAEADESEVAEETEEAEEVAAPEWTSLEDVQAALAAEDGVPAGVRPYLEAAVAQLGPKVAELETEKANLESEKLGLQQSKTVLTELAQKLEKGGLENAEELTANYIGILENVDAMSGDLADTSWQFFQTRHPEYEALPKDHPLRAMFAEMLLSGDHFTLFAKEKGYLAKVERAYELCAFRTKTDLAALAPKTAKPAKPGAPVVAAKGPATAALQRPQAARPKRGGSLVADGAMAPTRARRGVDERSWGEVMDEHEDLLDKPN